MNTNKRLSANFFKGDRVDVARELIGKMLCRRFEDGTMLKLAITETEAYGAEEDLACHASKGRTKRTEIMYHKGGIVYVYLIYGRYWMLNFVTGVENTPCAVLVRGIEGVSGPGRVGEALKLNKSFYGENLIASDRIWMEDAPVLSSVATPRIGIDYSGPIWSQKLWRFNLK